MMYEAAAARGDIKAKFSQAIYLDQGVHVSRDRKRAFELYSEAANAGHPIAMFNLAGLYAAGKGDGGDGAVEQDFNSARHWYEQAATVGQVVEAAINLGNMYRQGLGVPRDLVKAAAIFDHWAKDSEICRELLQAVEEEIKTGEGNREEQ
jgi:uncharacterized protein